MKIVMLSVNDWANVGGVYQECFTRVGLDAVSLCTVKHRFNYPNHSTWINPGLMKEYVKDADVVMFMHSEFIDTGVDLKDKIVAVVHTGSKYRQNAKSMNEFFNSIVDVTFSGGDVLGMGAKNEIWIQPAVDVKALQPVYKNNNDPYIIAHYPTGTKGYPIIQDVINGLTNRNFVFRYDANNIPWKEHLKRVYECDIYIEDMMDNQRGIPLLIYGIQTIEAAAQGKVVCTRFPIVDKYEKEFGKCGIQVANNAIQLTHVLESILSSKKEDFIKMQKESRKWVEKCQSYEVIGKRFKKIFKQLWKDKHEN